MHSPRSAHWAARCAAHRLWIALAGVASGCGYQPGSFNAGAKPAIGARATVGCLDVSVQRRADLSIGPVLAYFFANRCDGAATVDLAAAQVVGRDVTGAEVALRPYDPRGEIRALALDGRTTGDEALAYPSSRAMLEVCIDIAALAGLAPARWLCLGAAQPPSTIGSVP
jgi:hypothetical protein